MQTVPRAEPGHCVCSGFVPVPLCGKRTRAGRPGEAGVAAGCVSRAGLQGRCGSGNLQCAWPSLKSWSQRLPEAEKTWRSDCTWCLAAVATAPFLGLSSGSFSLPPSYLSVPPSIPVFTLTPAIAGSWFQGWSMGLLTTHWWCFTGALIYPEHGICWPFAFVTHLLLPVNDLGRFRLIPSLAWKRYLWKDGWNCSKGDVFLLGSTPKNPWR